MDISHHTFLNDNELDNIIQEIERKRKRALHHENSHRSTNLSTPKHSRQQIQTHIAEDRHKYSPINTPKPLFHDYGNKPSLDQVHPSTTDSTINDKPSPTSLSNDLQFTIEDITDDDDETTSENDIDANSIQDNGSKQSRNNDAAAFSTSRPINTKRYIAPTRNNEDNSKRESSSNNGHNPSVHLDDEHNHEFNESRLNELQLSTDTLRTKRKYTKRKQPIKKKHNTTDET